MKARLLFFLYLAFAATTSFAQAQYIFRISFVNKTGSTGTLSAPGDYLSARALARRSAQSIAIDSADLPVSKVYVDSVLKITSGILHTRSRWQNNCLILVNDTSTINFLRSNSFVKSATYVAVFSSPLHNITGSSPKKNGTPVNATPSTMRTTGGVGYYGAAYDQIKLANGDFLHDSGFRGKGKLIAVLDEGFAGVNTLPGYDSLRLSKRIVDTYNINLDTSDVYGYSIHGMQVLSTMAGIINGDFVGTAPDADYALYITENSSAEQPFEMDNLVAGMERADSVGADIISISLGYNKFSIGSLNADLSLTDIDGKSTVAAMGANVATQKGMLVVASAGNDGGTSWAKILTPGDADSALTCGSVDINKIRSLSSGKGPNAAGVRKPDVCMLGNPGVAFNSSGTSSSTTGTSIATPELAGLAACLWQKYPTAKPYQLREAIRQSAHIAKSPNDELGFGVPDFSKVSLSVPTGICQCFGSNVLVSPNPFKDNLSVTMGSNTQKGKMQYSLYNNQGQKIMGGEQEFINGYLFYSIDIPANFPAGMYMLHVIGEEHNKTFKLIKQ